MTVMRARLVVCWRLVVVSRLFTVSGLIIRMCVVAG